jgi:iron complex transport system substrate-binding protein
MNLLRSRAILAGLIAIALGAGWAMQALGADLVVTDAGGRQVHVADASRILSIGGDITEILYALGAGARLVGVDATSQFPPQALKEKKNVGYMRALSSEGVISVDATLVLASERSGPPEVVKTLKTTSVPYVEVPDEHSATGIANKVRLIARAIGAEGEKVVRQVVADFAALDATRAKIKKSIRALFVLGVQNGRVTVGGQGTSADAILKLAGAENVATAVNGKRRCGGDGHARPQSRRGARRRRGAAGARPGGGAGPGSPSPPGRAALRRLRLRGLCQPDPGHQSSVRAAPRHLPAAAQYKSALDGRCRSISSTARGSLIDWHPRFCRPVMQYVGLNRAVLGHPSQCV